MCYFIVSLHQKLVCHSTTLLQQKLILAGGETPINNSIVLYDALKKEFPEFIDEVDKKVGLGISF
jgi:hypothetical protein